MNKHYELIRESLEAAVSNGDIDIAFAERVNELAYNKYVTEDAETATLAVSGLMLLTGVVAITIKSAINHRIANKKFNAVIKYLKAQDPSFVNPSYLRIEEDDNLLSVKGLSPRKVSYAQKSAHEYLVGSTTTNSRIYSSDEDVSDIKNKTSNEQYAYDYSADKSCDVLKFYNGSKLFMIIAQVCDGEKNKEYFKLYDANAKKHEKLYTYYALARINCEGSRYTNYVLSLYDSLPEEYKIKSKKKKK